MFDIEYLADAAHSERERAIARGILRAQQLRELQLSRDETLPITRRRPSWLLRIRAPRQVDAAR